MPKASTNGEKKKLTSKHFFADQELDTKIDVAVAFFNKLHPTRSGKKTMQDFVRWCVERGIDDVNVAMKNGKSLG